VTHDHDIERMLDRWLSDGPIQVSDRVMDVVAGRIARQRQRPAWRLDRRLHPVNTYAKLAAAIAAVLIVAAGGLVILRPGSSNIGGPGPTPTPSPTATPSPSPSPTAVSCEDNIAGCAGQLAAGAHRSVHLQPALAFTTPDGWKNSIDAQTIFKLDPTDPSIPADAYIIVWSNVSISDQTATCDPVAKAGLGNAVQDWIDYLRAHPGLNASTPTPVSLGGSSGQAIDLKVRPTWTKTCPGGAAGHVVQFILDTDPIVGKVLYGASSMNRMHLLVLDVGGKTVIVQVYTADSDAEFNSTMAKVQPLIDSFVFTPGN
jgi:hypothetical protein